MPVAGSYRGRERLDCLRQPGIANCVAFEASLNPGIPIRKPDVNCNVTSSNPTEKQPYRLLLKAISLARAPRPGVGALNVLRAGHAGFVCEVSCMVRRLAVGTH
jgi:hypothetical protein